MPSNNITLAHNLHGLIDGSGLRSPNTPYVELMNSTVAELTSVLDNVRTGVDRAGRNQELSPEGKLAAKRRIGELAMPKIDAANMRMKRLQYDLKSVGPAPTRFPTDREWAKQNSMDINYAASVLSEIREKLLSLDIAQRNVVLQQAARDGDTAILVAATGPNPLLQVSNSDTLQSALTKWIETQTTPEAKAVSEAVDTLNFNIATAKRRTSEISGFSEYLLDPGATQVA